MKSHYVYKPHLSVGSVPSSRWPIQNELIGISVVFLSHIALFKRVLFSSCLTGLLLKCYDFNFCVFMGLCVVCVCFVFLPLKILIYFPFYCLFSKEKEK